MTPTTGPGGPYRVSYLPDTESHLRAWTAIAIRVGLTASYSAALKNMVHRLGTDPAGWGEEQFDWHGMQATQFLAHGPVRVVAYAVDAAHLVVYVQSVPLTRGSPRARAVLSSS